MPSAISSHAKLDSNDLGEELYKKKIQLLHYFAQDTTEKILKHIDRLDIKDTGTLRNSIRSVVYANAGGDSQVVSFYMKEYGLYVERAVGKYWGVDNDLGKGIGVKGRDIEVPPVTSRDYGPLNASFHLPVNQRREETHRPRPFWKIEIKRQIERISYRLLEECLSTVEIHMLNAIDEALMPNVEGSIYRKEGFIEV